MKKKSFLCSVFISKEYDDVTGDINLFLQTISILKSLNQKNNYV